MPNTDVSLPCDAYNGTEPYIFVSYSHQDRRAVFPEIKHLHDQGYRIWYDEGIEPGNEWPYEIAQALDRAAYFLVFITESACASKNVRNEVNFAIGKNKHFIAVHLAETVLPPGLELQIGGIQAILKHRLRPDRYRRKLIDVLPAHLRVSSRGLSGGDSATIPRIGSTVAVDRPSFWHHLSGWFAANTFFTGRDRKKHTIRENASEDLQGGSPEPRSVLDVNTERVEQRSVGNRGGTDSVLPIVLPNSPPLPDSVLTTPTIDISQPALMLSRGRDDVWASDRPLFGKSFIRRISTKAQPSIQGEPRFGRAVIRTRAVEYGKDGLIKPEFGPAKLARTFGIRHPMVNAEFDTHQPQFGRATLHNR